MNNSLTFNKIESLPTHLKNEVNDFVDFLLDKEKRKAETKKSNDIHKFSGIISDNEADLWKKTIEEGCGKIDYDGWK
jgi:hypothetical protein